MKDQKKNLNLKDKLKQLVVACMTVLVFALPIAGVVLTRPQPALAQGAPTIDIANLTQNLGKFIKDVVLEGLKQGAALAFKNALKVFVSQIAYDTAVWIGSGDANQKPLLYTKDVGSYIKDVGDSAAGEFLNTLFSENGYFEYDLCQPLDVYAQRNLNLAIGLAIPNLNFSTFGIQLPEANMPVVECTLTEIIENFEDASFDVDFPTQVALFFIPTNNDFGVYTSAVGKGYEVSAEQKEKAVIDRQNSDFLPVSGKTSGYIATPGSAVEHQYFLSLDASSYPQTTYTGQLLADTIDIFTSTLISKLLDRLKTGLIADFTTSDITDSLSGSSSTSGGVSAAQEKFITFKEIPITRGTDLDVLSDLANCPDQGRDITNCVIDEGFRSAIEQGKTVQQALDDGLIDGSKPFAFGDSGLPIESAEQGIQYRSTIILKHYRIVPVGWQIAAEYLRDFGGGTSVTLQDLVDAYDQCDSTNYSPYCKLVDPDWVLTSPDGICNLQGYGQTILSSRFEDDDGLFSTPERPNILRAQSCLDDQTCLKSDSDGNCIAYGYCREEKRIYRFQGDECPEQYSSCQTYTDSNDEEVSYLRNTLNFNNCDANSVGCQWYCSVYNDINLDWQCASNGRIYETCSSDSNEYVSSAGTCDCEVDVDGTTETCDMQDGAFECTTSNGNACTLGTLRDSSTAFDCTGSSGGGTFSITPALCSIFTALGISGGSGIDSAMNFNNQVTECEDEDIGCTTYIRTASGANLISNSSFEYFNSYNDAPEDIVRGEDELTDTTVDTFGFYAEDADDPGTACSADSTDNDCLGWESSGRVFATSDDTFDGFVAAELVGPATLTYELETGYPLANRTFDLSLFSQNTGTTTCVAQIELNGELLSNPDYTGVATSNITLTGNNTWASNVFEAYTYPSTTTSTELSLVITVTPACTSPIKVDAVDLTETDDSSDFTAYGTTEQISMNGDRLECAVEDIGCELYTPVGGSDTDEVPGQITNILSDDCTGTDGYKDPDCSQCNGTNSDDEFVGCDFYQEQPLENSAPVPSLAGFTTVPTGDEREGIVQRTGYYCNTDGYEGVSCYDDADCGAVVGACVDSVSIIPSTAETCSAQYVGCEEYTNLDTVSEGGEGIEHYSYIKQCVKDTPEQRDNDEIKTFVTFEGSDVSGYSLRSFDLKKSDADDGPCTNLDLYGSTAESSEAVCIDSTSTPQTCTAADVGVDADCTEFIDPDTGTSYYRLKSYTITASDDCHPLRNDLDGRIYYSVPSESTECPSSQNLCREYKGSAGGDVFQAINEDFEDSVWDAVSTTGTVEQSSESTAAGGHSMSLNTASASYDLFTVGDEGTTSSLDEGKTYILELWAKQASTTGTGLSISFYSATSASTNYFVQSSVNSVSGKAVTVDDDWHKYTFGPVILPRAGEADDQMVISWSGTTDLYLDNILLEESDAQYLIKNTSDTCGGYEGCEDYTDRAGDTHYIKSFSRLCEEQYVGCEVLIDTANSDSPYSQTFLTDNDFTYTDGPVDDVTVAPDQVVVYVNDEDNYCATSEAGCTEFGEPDEDEVTGLADSFTSISYINDPDTYSSILCETDALTCDEYTGTNDEIVYFKNPGDRTCEYRQETTGSEFGWFIAGADVACPLFDESDTPGQPMGAICDGGDRDGLFCVSDGDCPDDDDTDSDEPHCRSDLTTDADSDDYPDTGWTGTCSSAYSGCTEYQDANTDNLIPNGGFEDDIYSTDANGDVDEEVIASDGLPDYFNYLNIACDTLEQNSTATNVHSGVDSLIVGQDTEIFSGSGIGCWVTPDARIDVDVSQTYTLSANVMVPNAFTGANVSKISLGLRYYDSDGQLIEYDYDGDNSLVSTGDFDDYPIYDVAARAETISSSDDGVWLRYTGEIGNRLETTWPSTDAGWSGDVDTILPVITVYTPSGQVLFVDDFSFTQNSAYFYVNDSVDGAPESDQNTCNGEVNIGEGCVAFRDVTNKDLTYLSVVETEREVNGDFSVSSCTIGATESEDENCRFNADAADGNVVLQVRPDRECAEWLSCRRASITTDSDGNEEVTCLELGACDELSDSGLCGNTLQNTDSEDLTSSDDLTFRSNSGSTVSLDNIKNASGYTKIGVRWADSDGTCSSGVCASDSPLEGESCSSNDDCQVVNRIQGYYPYNNMVEEGTEGLSSENVDLLADGDFEEVFCNYSSGDSITINGISTNVSTLFLHSRDLHQSCILDDHCRNPNTEARFEEMLSIDESDGSREVAANFDYSEGWCSNPDAAGESYREWDPTSGTTISVVNYDPSVDFENPSSVFDDNTPNVGSYTLDFNNVLYVAPGAAGQGVDYQFDVDELANGDQFALSFRAGWAESAGESDHLTISLKYSDGTTTTDDFFHLCNSDGCGETSVELTSDLESYALTLTAADIPEDPTSIYLAIHSSTDTAFYLDDVSMMPNLEVSQELNNIGRECRAYPAEDSLQCNYTDKNGAVYTGIHGYCLEEDGLFRNKCVTWWPLEVISGEPDSRTKTPAGYDGRTNVYYCAVAKGLENLMVCEGGQRDGAICSGLGSGGDAYCQGDQSSGDCIASVDYNDIPRNPDNGETIIATTGSTGGYQIIPRSIFFATDVAGLGDGFETMIVRSSDANAVEQALTLADINEIRLSVDTGAQDAGEFEGEWPVLGSEWNLSSDDANIDSDGNVTQNDGSQIGRANYYEDQQDNTSTQGGLYCRWTYNGVDANGDGSIKWVWNAEEDRVIGEESYGPDLCDKDPFFEPSSYPSFNSDVYDILNTDPDEEAYYNAFLTQSDLAPSLVGEHNLIAFNFVFDDGVLDYVQWIVLSSIGDDYVEATFTVEYQLNETCVLAVQAVDENGNTTAWLDRLSSDSGYTLPNTNYAYSDANSPFGSVHSSFTDTPDLWEGDFDSTPFDANDRGVLVMYRESETVGSGLPFACVGLCNNNMCQGFDAEHPVDHGYGGSADQECNEDESYSCSDTTSGLCLGVDGNNDFSGAGISETYDDASGSAQVADYDDQLHAAMNVAREDLSMIFADLEGGTAWAREENQNSLTSNPTAFINLWEDFGVSNIFDDMDECSGTRSSTDYCGIRPEVNSIEVNSQGGDVFINNGESIRLNFGTTADDNQVPVTNIRIDFEGVDGHSWDTDFDADDDTDDTWNAAPSSDHIYTNSYTCDKTDQYYQELDSGSDYAGSCIYEIRVQIQDEWGFCSGSLDTSDIRSAGSDGCSSYDEFAGYVVVTPN